MTNLIGIYDHNTGEQIIREMTAEEQAEREKEVADYLAAKEADLKAKADAKAIAEAKLEALGLSADDLKALGL